MQDINDTLLSQYANSPTITGLINAFNQWIDPAANLDAFYEIVWNVDTAEGFGLDIWGKIVNVPRQLQIDATTTVTLGDPAYRKLIMVKAAANICDCTAPSLNNLLRYMFAGEGRTYVIDTGSMTMRYVFEFSLTATELAIMLSSNVIPRPAGVLISILQAAPEATFGFVQGQLQPFGQGTFFSRTTGLQDAN